MKTFLALIGAVVVIGLACLFFFGVLAGVAPHNTQTTPESSGAQSVDAPQPPAPAIQVSATQLYFDYHRNEVAADAKYKDKVLTLDGIVTGINKDALGEMYLTLATGFDEYSSVDAKLDAREASWAAGLEVMQNVALRCTGGTMIIGIPVLDGCVPETQRQAPPPVYTPKPSASEEPAQPPTEASSQVPVQTAVYSQPAAPSPQVTADQYEDNFLLQMKSHWMVPPGTPKGTRAEISVSVAPDGRIYGATVDTPSTFPALDQSCINALNQMPQAAQPPDGKILQFSFDCTSK
jgi:hypothetical protein